MIFNTNTKQISFVIVFLFAFINSCLANDNVDFFSSSGIKVNLSFSNETDIRNSAISKAEEIAFKRVSVKLLTPEDYKKLSKLKDIDISYFVESVEFVDEKISTETYLGEFNIYFSPFRIKEFYKSNSLTFSEVSSQNITVNVAFSNSNQFFILFNLERDIIWNFLKASFVTFLDQIKKTQNRPIVGERIKRSEKMIKNNGRMLVRKSGTEPKIRIMGESNNINLLKNCINIVKRSIK